ncbi:MAG: matrixin family metalloprotease [Chthoniobacterales bacterium]
MVLLASLLFVGHSFAFRESTNRWTLNRTVTIHLSLGPPDLLDDGFTSFNQSAADALNIWNNYLVHLRFAPVLASSLPAADSDADNSVFFESTIYGETFGLRTLAVTLVSSRNNVRVETDVIFNSAELWNSYRGPLRDDVADFHRVALHEFGHALGLEHPDQAGQVVNAIMNSRVSGVDALQADDIAGARSIYNNGPAYLTSNPAPNLVNLSTRAGVGTGEKVLIGGFIIQGSQPATVVLRAIGHSLAARGINNALDDPVMELRNAAGTLVAESDDWFEGPNAETIASYRLDPSNSLESALLQTLAPGSYTVIVHPYDDGTPNLSGTALVELYDLHTTNGRAGNIATRGQVLADDPMIAGYIIGGSQSKEVIVRGLGPSLSSAGIANALADPMLEVFNSSGTRVASNDNWQTDANAGRVQTVGLAPTQPVEAAIDITLNPGAYTAVLSGRNHGSGIGLVEVYDLSTAPN